MNKKNIPIFSLIALYLGATTPAISIEKWMSQIKSGRVSEVNTNQRSITINRKQFNLAPKVKLHGLSSGSGVISQLQSGMIIQYRMISATKNRHITEIWK